MEFNVTFKDNFIDVRDEEHAQELLLNYLRDCVEYMDIDAFEFEVVDDSK